MGADLAATTNTAASLLSSGMVSTGATLSLQIASSQATRDAGIRTNRIFSTLQAAFANTSANAWTTALLALASDQCDAACLFCSATSTMGTSALLQLRSLSHRRGGCNIDMAIHGLHNAEPRLRPRAELFGDDNPDFTQAEHSHFSAQQRYRSAAAADSECSVRRATSARRHYGERRSTVRSIDTVPSAVLASTPASAHAVGR